METWNRLEPSREKFQNGVMTIGNFDGLHLGHQTLLRQMSSSKGPKIVLTFDPHPAQILHPERALKRIFPREDLWERLPAYGVDLLLILPFDRAFSQLSGDDFLQTFVQDAFHPHHLVTGYDFAFGRGRSGTLDDLKKWAKGHGMLVDVMPPLEVAGSVVSSRRIRECIESADVKMASVLLGRPFYLRGRVGSGAGRGQGIGFPTLNQEVENETWPKQGVYATRTVHRGRSYPSVTNVGTNPTFETGREVKVETHVLDARAEWRGDSIDVEFIERLRDEMKFSGVEDLKNQIQADILKARRILGDENMDGHRH